MHDKNTNTTSIQLLDLDPDPEKLLEEEEPLEIANIIGKVQDRGLNRISIIKDKLLVLTYFKDDKYYLYKIDILTGKTLKKEFDA